ncbi:MAG: hypothetical protein ABGY41_04275 [Candidatus Poribacteria bacterium]
MRVRSHIPIVRRLRLLTAFLTVMLLPLASGCATGVSEAMRDVPVPNWLKAIAKQADDEPVYVFLAGTILVTVITTLARALRRDRILRRNNGRFGVLLHPKGRYPGIIKLILKDVEVASEKTDVEGKDSGRMFTEEEFKKMRGVVLYHDEMTEKDMEERRVFAERVRHPTLSPGAAPGPTSPSMCISRWPCWGGPTMTRYCSRAQG